MGFFSDRNDNKKRAATREFVFETIRNLDYVVTRDKLSQFIKLQESSNILYAYLYGIALFTWSVRETTIDYDDYEEIFNIVDNALRDSGINLQRHLDLIRDYDEISSGFADIFNESIGMSSITNDSDLIASVNQDFQGVGICYASAYSRNDMELAKIYLVKLVNTIDEKT